MRVTLLLKRNTARLCQAHLKILSSALFILPSSQYPPGWLNNATALTLPSSAPLPRPAPPLPLPPAYRLLKESTYYVASAPVKLASAQYECRPRDSPAPTLYRSPAHPGPTLAMQLSYSFSKPTLRANSTSIFIALQCPRNPKVASNQQHYSSTGDPNSA